LQHTWISIRSKVRHGSTTSKTARLRVSRDFIYQATGLLNQFLSILHHFFFSDSPVWNPEPFNLRTLLTSLGSWNLWIQDCQRQIPERTERTTRLQRRSEDSDQSDGITLPQFVASIFSPVIVSFKFSLSLYLPLPSFVRIYSSLQPRLRIQRPPMFTSRLFINGTHSQVLFVLATRDLDATQENRTRFGDAKEGGGGSGSQSHVDTRFPLQGEFTQFFLGSFVFSRSPFLSLWNSNSVRIGPYGLLRSGHWCAACP
jgi:hypothetical protein